MADSEDFADPTFKIDAEVTVEPQDLVDHLDREDLLNFIMRVDAAVEDWDFTLELYERFARLKEAYDKEGEELAKEKATDGQ